MSDTPDYTEENNVLGLAEDIINYVLNELRNNREDWYYQFNQLSPEGQKMLYRALADGFNDSVDN